MEGDKKIPAGTKKQNQDFPNIPSSTEKVNEGNNPKTDIKATSKLNPDGKTDNTDKQEK